MKVTFYEYPCFEDNNITIGGVPAKVISKKGSKGMVNEI